VRLTVQLHWSGHAPAASVRTGRTTAGAARVLHLDYVCAASSPCTEDYRLSVPARTAVAVSQPSGHVTISGLNAPLRISAGSVDVSASRLRSPTLTATITSGHLAAAFGVAPRRVSLTLTSAQATVHLPAVAPGYQLSQQVTSGYVHVGVTQAASSPHRVSVRISSGELELLP
jgi:putative adhesin